MLSNDVGILRWCSEVRPKPHPSLHRLGDDWMGVSLHHAADAVMHVKVLVTVDVPDVLAESALEIDRVWGAALIARRDATDERLLRSGVGGP